MQKLLLLHVVNGICYYRVRLPVRFHPGLCQIFIATNLVNAICVTMCAYPSGLISELIYVIIVAKIGMPCEILPYSRRKPLSGSTSSSCSIKSTANTRPIVRSGCYYLDVNLI